MGNDFQIGIGVEIGNQRGGHHHGNDPWAGDRFPQRPYPPQQRVDPITVEAMQIARELDSGQTHRAAEHLRRDLQQMPSFRDQRELVQKIDAFERKGVGADLRLRGRPDREFGIWDDIAIIPPRYYDRGGHHGNRPGYPPVYGRGGGYGNGRPDVDIHIDLNLFKNRGRR